MKIQILIVLKDQISKQRHCHDLDRLMSLRTANESSKILPVIVKKDYITSKKIPTFTELYVSQAEPQP